jgi:hypothetical protein
MSRKGRSSSRAADVRLTNTTPDFLISNLTFGCAIVEELKDCRCAQALGLRDGLGMLKEGKMGILRFALLVVSILAILIGLVWVGQGTGYFPYPASSFMINQMPWAYYGGSLAVLGVIGVVVSGRV